MPLATRALTVRQDGDRNSIRRRVVEAFLKEEPGQGTGSLARGYRYDVEVLADGRRVYLTRPGWLNKGFDFLINLEGAVFSNGKENPKHEDIRSDLAAKAAERPEAFERLREALRRVHACEDPDDVMNDLESLGFDTGLSIEALLKIIKWFFIEQDLCYWLYSGRGKFLKEVIDAVGS